MKYFLVVFSLFLVFKVACQEPAKVLETYAVPQARQAVAVDSLYFYVINNRSITKHLKSTGKLKDSWENDAALQHLNSGIIIDDKLYSAHSNYPDEPMISSIEVFDPVTMKHIDNISLGIQVGSATWIDYYNGDWYVAFAHYTGRGSELGKYNAWTQLVQFNKNWQREQAWVFPKKLIERFGTRSNSGGFIAKNGIIFATGHDEKEVYELHFPKMGATLIWKNTYAVPFEGQGIAVDKITEEILVLYGIVKRENKVYSTELHMKK